MLRNRCKFPFPLHFPILRFVDLVSFQVSHPHVVIRWHMIVFTTGLFVQFCDCRIVLSKRCLQRCFFFFFFCEVNSSHESFFGFSWQWWPLGFSCTNSWPRAFLCSFGDVALVLEAPFFPVRESTLSIFFVLCLQTPSSARRPCCWVWPWPHTSDANCNWHEIQGEVATLDDLSIANLYYSSPCGRARHKTHIDANGWAGVSYIFCFLDQGWFGSK